MNMLTRMKSKIEISVSQDEFCRSIESSIDEQNSFTFTKQLDSFSNNDEPKMMRGAKNSSANRQARNKLYQKRNQNKTKNTKRNNMYPCKFPKWLNKKWHNLKQTKSYKLDYKLDSLIVHDDKANVNVNKYICHQVKAKKPSHVQMIVRSLNGW